MTRIEKPWGYEEIWAETNSYVGKIIHINRNQRLSLQYHEYKEETIMVLTGVLRVWENEDDNDFKDLNQGEVYHVHPRKIHRFGATTFNPVTIVEVSTPELDDVIRLKDDYKR